VAQRHQIPASLLLGVEEAMEFFDGPWIDDDMLWIKTAADEIDALNDCEPAVLAPDFCPAYEFESAPQYELAEIETDAQRVNLFAQLYRDGSPRGAVSPPRTTGLPGERF
jgi:hypothetical protein